MWGNNVFKAHSCLSMPRVSCEAQGCKKEALQTGAPASSLPSTLWSLPYALSIPIRPVYPTFFKARGDAVCEVPRWKLALLRSSATT